MYDIRMFPMVVTKRAYQLIEAEVTYLYCAEIRLLVTSK